MSAGEEAIGKSGNVISAGKPPLHRPQRLQPLLASADGQAQCGSAEVPRTEPGPNSNAACVWKGIMLYMDLDPQSCEALKAGADCSTECFEAAPCNTKFEGKP